MDVFRTPDERFEGLPGYPWEARYRDWEGMRLAHVDEGEGEPVVMLHGEPTWSYLWRKVMPPLLEAGHRCIAPDLPEPAWPRIVDALDRNAARARVHSH